MVNGKANFTFIDGAMLNQEIIIAGIVDPWFMNRIEQSGFIRSPHKK
jgi:prepilin-type processing-associated H-X9-DG protein